MKRVLVFSFLFFISSLGMINVDAAPKTALSTTNANEQAIGTLQASAAASAAASAGGSNGATKLLGALSVGIGGYMIKTSGCPKTPCNVPRLVMGIMALAQGANAFQTAKQNKGVQKQICGLYCKEGNGLAEVSSVNGDAYGVGGSYASDIDKYTKLAKKAGVYIKGGNVVSPNKTVPLSQAGSLAGIGKAFDLSKGQLAAMQTDMDKIKAKILKKYGGGRIGLAGGGKGSSKARRVRKKIVYEGSKASNTSGAKRYTASVKGFSKKFGDSMIGVKGDDIFQMIHRTYVENYPILFK